MNHDLIKFIREWKQWVDKGATDHPVFFRECGLCSMVTAWGLAYEIEKGRRRLLEEAFYAELEKQSFNDQRYPFGGYSRYMNEQKNRTAHTNPYRLAFVENFLATYGQPEIAIREDGWGDTRLTTRYEVRAAIERAITKLTQLSLTIYEPDPFNQLSEPAAAKFLSEVAYKIHLVAKEAWVDVAEIASGYANRESPPEMPDDEAIAEYLAEIEVAAEKYEEEIKIGE